MVKREGINTKPIVCPECVIQFEKTQNDKPDETGENQDEELMESVKVETFTNWKAYAYHILTAHPESQRIDWVISCVNAEQEQYTAENRQLPKSTETLLKLIKNPQDTIKPVETKDDEPPILIDEKDWKTKLEELHGIMDEVADDGKEVIHLKEKNAPIK